jgi:lysophospholipid acyltransferase
VNANKWVTMLTSAFWHGFFPGYYLAFMTAPFIQETTSAIYTSWGKITASLFGWKLRDLKSGGDGCQFPDSSLWVLPRLLWILVRWLGVLFSFCYSLGPFCLLKFNMGIAFWTYLGFVGHLAPLAFRIFSTILAAILVPRKQKQSASSAEKSASEPSSAKSERSSRNSKKE